LVEDDYIIHYIPTRRSSDLDGPDLVDRCYSEVKHEVNKELYTKRNNLKESNAVINTKRIIDKPIKYGFVDLRFPLSDHARLWNKDGKPFSYTSEPYNLSKNDMKKLMDHCEKYGLDFHISNNSFHYPAGTLFIEIKKQNRL